MFTLTYYECDIHSHRRGSFPWHKIKHQGRCSCDTFKEALRLYRNCNEVWNVKELTYNGKTIAVDHFKWHR